VSADTAAEDRAAEAMHSIQAQRAAAAEAQRAAAAEEKKSLRNKQRRESWRRKQRLKRALVAASKVQNTMRRVHDLRV